MQAIIKRSIVIAAALVVLAGAFARADASEVMRMKVPFPFVVHERTLPAGHYLLLRDDSDPSVLLIRADNGSHAGVYVMTTNASGHDPAGDKPAVSFIRTEKQYTLASVWESGTEGKTVASR